MRYTRHIATAIASGVLLTSMLATTAGCRNGGLFNQQTIALANIIPAQNLAVAARKQEPASEADQPTARPDIRYEAFPVKGAKQLAALKSRFGEEGFAAALRLNRVDRNHVRNGATLIVPIEETDMVRLSPFPLELESTRSISKLILVSRRVQAFAAYESGKLIYWGPVSTGKKATPTPAGLYFTNWKSKETRSTVNSSWVLPWYFNLDNFGGVGFHQYDLPGYPASHGCARLLKEDAQWIFNWAEQWILSKAKNSIAAYGTPVVIFGNYAYGAKAPWKQLIEDPHAADVSIEEIEAALRPHLQTVEARTQSRQTLLASAAQTATTPASSLAHQ